MRWSWEVLQDLQRTGENSVILTEGLEWGETENTKHNVIHLGSNKTVVFLIKIRILEAEAMLMIMWI